MGGGTIRRANVVVTTVFNTIEASGTNCWLSPHLVTTSIPMGWYQEELAPEEKIEKAKKLKEMQEKAIKRAVLGPKQSRWR